MHTRSLDSLLCVSPGDVKEIWPHVKHFIKAAAEKTKLEAFENIERDILSGRQLLWLAWDGHDLNAAACTFIYLDACIITACGGRNRHRWLRLLDQIEQYAAGEACRCVRIYGRKGWAKELRNYETRFYVLERQL